MSTSTKASTSVSRTSRANIGISSASISILMPIYNGVEFFIESLQSVLDQTAEEWELLIAINGHPPNSEVYQKVLKQVNAITANVRLFDYHDCKGKAATLNKMITECKSNYVALLDVDDIWHPEKLAAQSPFLMLNYDVVGTRCVYFGDINNVVPQIPTADISQFNFLAVNPVINSSAIIKKKFAHWDTTLFGVEDYDLWLSLRAQGRRFYNCEEVLVKHRIHQTSAFNAKGNGNHVAALKQAYAHRIMP